MFVIIQLRGATGRLVVVRTAREEIGYYAADALKTEQQIYDEFTIEEDVQLILELENREEMERKKEAEFDAALKVEPLMPLDQ